MHEATYQRFITEMAPSHHTYKRWAKFQYTPAILFVQCYGGYCNNLSRWAWTMSFLVTSLQALSFFATHLCWLQHLRTKFIRCSWESWAGIVTNRQRFRAPCAAQGAPGLAREQRRCANCRAASAKRTMCCDQTTKNTHHFSSQKNTSVWGARKIMMKCS